MAEVSNVQASFPMILDKPISVVVTRPTKNKGGEEDEEDQEEILVIEGIEVKKDEFVKFDVFINDEDDMAARVGGDPEKIKCAGSFVHVPHKQKGGDGAGAGVGGKVIKTKLRLGISELLESLGAEDDDEHVVVKLVPKCDNVHVKIGGIKIEIE